MGGRGFAPRIASYRLFLLDYATALCRRVQPCRVFLFHHRPYFRTDGLNFTHRHFSSIPSRQKQKKGGLKMKNIILPHIVYHVYFCLSSSRAITVHILLLFPNSHSQCSSPSGHVKLPCVSVVHCQKTIYKILDNMQFHYEQLLNHRARFALFQILRQAVPKPFGTSAKKYLFARLAPPPMLIKL